MATEALDLDGRYTVESMPGIVFYLRGYVEELREVEWAEYCPDADETLFFYDVEPWTNTELVRAVMVGDDREHVIDVDELTRYDDDVCSCGQVGCGWH